MQSSIKIAYLNKDQRVWFIRSNSGLYAKNFRHGNVVAIKHLEEALGNQLGDNLPTEDDIRSALFQNDKYFTFIEDNKTKKQKKVLNRKGHNLLSQIKRFANDIQAGDLVVTKNEEDGYIVGICTDSNAYIEQTPIELPKSNREEDPQHLPILRYKFRKKVTWGPSIPQTELPSSVKRATRGQQTITNLSDHKEKIFHLIYPFFTDGENLYFSNKIRATDDINARVIGKLFENISLAEAITQSLLTDHEVSLPELASLLLDSIFTTPSLVTCKAEFMSPGDMWCKIPLPNAQDALSQVIAATLVCLMLTGQASAIQLEDITDIAPTAVIKLQANEASPGTDMFNEKFQPASPSNALDSITKKLKKKKAEVKALEKQSSAQKIQESLNLGMTNNNTQNLENFKYGINVIELRNLNENN